MTFTITTETYWCWPVTITIRSNEEVLISVLRFAYEPSEELV